MMLKRGLATLALATVLQAAFALEFGIDAETGNLQFPWDQTSPLPASVAAFPTTNYFWGGEAWLNAPLGDEASVRVSYDRDPVLRNMMIAAVQFERGIARISVGPLFGFYNSDSTPFSAGLSASVRLQWPGVAYVSLSSDGGTAISVFQSDADPQARTELSAGFYVPHAIVSGLVSVKRFNDLDSGGQLVSDSLTRYAMTIDVFKKNVPYTGTLSIGYELRSKHYAASASTDSLGAIVLGLGATAELDRAWSLKGGISTGAYVFGLDSLQGRGPGNSAFLFSADLGVSVDVSQIRLPPKREAAEAPTPEAAPAVAPEATPAPAADAAPKPEEAAPPPEAEKPAFSRLVLDVGAGLYYNDKISLAGSLAIAGELFNSRGGIWGDIGYRLTPQFSVGAELGIDYLTLSSSGTSLSFFDLPVRANFRYELGKASFEAFTGPFINGVDAGSAGFASFVDYDFGARVRLAGFYAEASYVLGIGSTGISIAGVASVAADYPRFGLGYALKLK
jgi:hypothetical protein